MKYQFPITLVSLGGIWRVTVYNMRELRIRLAGHWRIVR